MIFQFERSTSKFSGITKVEVSVINGTSAADHVGTLHVDLAEWELLRAMLLEGAKLFQDNEATVELIERDHQPAYLEGVE